MRTALLILLLVPAVALAQTPVAVLDTGAMRSGEQVSVLLSIDLTSEQHTAAMQWPEIGNTLSPNVEVIRIGSIDTTHLRSSGAADLIHLEQRITITSFDTGFWAIPPFRFIIGGNVLETAAMLLEVRKVDLGEAPELRDIKDIHEVPFSLAAWLGANWYWMVISLLIAALFWWLVQRWRNRPVQPMAPVIKERELPIHERILQELRSLETEQLWHNGAHKEYHSRLTDLLREYIEVRYKVPALERTTDELLQELRISALGRDHHLQLRNMLQLADMVKFAKALPTPAQNEQMMRGAMRFVEETAPERTVHAHA